MSCAEYSASSGATVGTKRIVLNILLEPVPPLILQVVLEILLEAVPPPI